jgi:hypothetical protein
LCTLHFWDVPLLGLFFVAALPAGYHSPSRPAETGRLRNCRNSADIELVSTRKGPTTGEPPFLVENRKRFTITRETPGTAMDAGPNWIIVDFGQGLTLTFRLSDNGIYVLPAWGTVSIGGERYDLQMGILTGTLIELEYGVSGP